MHVYSFPLNGEKCKANLQVSDTRFNKKLHKQWKRKTKWCYPQSFSQEQSWDTFCQLKMALNIKKEMFSWEDELQVSTQNRRKYVTMSVNRANLQLAFDSFSATWEAILHGVSHILKQASQGMSQVKHAYTTLNHSFIIVSLYYTENATKTIVWL